MANNKALFVALVCSLFAATIAQSCSFQQKAWVDYNSVKGCINSIAPNPTQQQQTLDTINKGLQLYAFRDINKDSPGSQLMHITVDIFAQLQNISQTSFATDFQFHQAIGNVLLSLHDAHTTYSKPSCYRIFSVQPFALSSLYNASISEQQIFISGIYQYASKWNQDFTKYNGWTVIGIDDDDALGHIVAYALQNAWLSKDVSVMFNWALESGFQQRVLSLFDIPAKNARKYALQDPKSGNVVDVVVPYLMVVAGGDITAQNCFAPPSSNQAANSVNVLEQFSVPKEFKLLQGQGTKKAARAGGSFSSDAISMSQFDSDTMVLRITSFEPQDSNDAFLNTIEEGIKYAQDNGLTQLIIDLRGNGGGDICLGYQVLHRLMEEDHPEGRYDVIHSEISTAAFYAGVGLPPSYFLVSPQWWDDEQGNTYYNISWYDPGQTHIRGGVKGQYSERVYHACDYVKEDLKYKFKGILVVSDGTCGSTCAVFSSHLDEVDNIDTVAVGGLYNTPTSYMSFPGGEVIGLNDVIQLLQALNVANNPAAPKPFVTSADLRYTFLEIYPWSTKDPVNTPLEFVWKPATHKLDFWFYGDENTELLYNQVLPFFQHINMDVSKFEKPSEILSNERIY
jgi:hypothetical protein